MATLQPVRRRSLSDAVFEQLRDQIVEGELEAGAPLPAERVLCESLDVNRGAVREAIRRLEQARLVSVRHGGSSRVLDYRESASIDLLADLLVRPDGTFDERVVAGVLEMRSAIAPDIARLAAERAGASDETSGGNGSVAERLENTVAEMKAADGDLATLQRLAARFWSELVDGSQNVAYRLAYNALREVYERCWTLLTGPLADEIGDVAAYRAIARAVRGRRPEKARALARELVGRGEHSILTALAAIRSEQERSR